MTGSEQAATEDRSPGGDVSIRCFAALDLDPAASADLAQWGRDIAEAADAPVRPVPQEDLHVTFAFLGDVPEYAVADVALAMEEVAGEVPGPIHCTITGASTLGPSDNVLAATVDLDLLAVLAAARDRFLSRAARSGVRGWDDRPWYPHVTVARAPGRRDISGHINFAQALATVPAASWVSPALSLVASIPGPGGLRHYRKLSCVPFALPSTLGSRS